METVELAETHGWFYTRQFENEANPDIHSRTTAREILADFQGGRLDYWVTGYGTGGTLKGVARVLAKERPDTKIVVCEPADAQLLGSGAPQPRNPDGSAAAAHPDNPDLAYQAAAQVLKAISRRGRRDANVRAIAATVSGAIASHAQSLAAGKTTQASPLVWPRPK